MITSGKLVQFLGRHILEGNLMLANLIEKFFEKISLQTSLQQHFINSFIGFYRLHHRTQSVNDIFVGHSMKNKVQR